MTLNQILYFQKVARLENYHQAAEELYISQPSLSRSMAALESELGVALFEKKGRGVTLTKAGKLFLEHADRIAGDCDIAVGKMQELSSDGGKIDIGYIFPLAGHYIPHKVRKFLNKEDFVNVLRNFNKAVLKQNTWYELCCGLEFNTSPEEIQLIYEHIYLNEHIKEIE